MKKWGWKFWGLVGFIIVIVASMTTIAFMHTSLTKSSAPAIPEAKQGVKSDEPMLESPVLKKAQEISVLVKELYKQGIRIHTLFLAAEEEKAAGKAFLAELLADKNSQKIFSQFSKMDIAIILSHRYYIGDGNVEVCYRDGVEKVAKWLATGKI